MNERTRIVQRVGRVSQNDRILELLADGRWHTTREILQAIPCIVHSRIAEINGRGLHRIEHDGGGAGSENHRYRLVRASGAGEASAAAVSLAPDAPAHVQHPAPAEGTDGSWACDPAEASDNTQLRLVA